MTPVFRLFLLVIISAGGRTHVLNEGEIEQHPYFENEKEFEQVGCFRDKENDRSLPNLLQNFRPTMDWKNPEQVVKKCAKAVNSEGYVYFGIQFWGECWTGKDAHATYDKHGPSENGCYNSALGKARNNYVYRLTNSSEHECHSKVHSIYDQADRSRFSGSGSLCDYSRSQHNPGWYRFSGAAGMEMATSCVPIHHCTTQYPGWYKGQLPNVLDKEPATGKGCFSESTDGNESEERDCCKKTFTVTVKARNCGRFTVWHLPRPRGCKTRYCGNGTSSQLLLTL